MVDGSVKCSSAESAPLKPQRMRSGHCCSASLTRILCCLHFTPEPRVHQRTRDGACCGSRFGCGMKPSLQENRAIQGLQKTPPLRLPLCRVCLCLGVCVCAGAHVCSSHPHRIISQFSRQCGGELHFEDVLQNNQLFVLYVFLVKLIMGQKIFLRMWCRLNFDCTEYHV